MSGNGTKVGIKIRKIFCVALILSMIFGFYITGTAALSLCNGTCCLEFGHNRVACGGQDAAMCSPLVQLGCCGIENAGPEIVQEFIAQVSRNETHSHATAVSVSVNDVSLNPSIPPSRSDSYTEVWTSVPLYLQKASLLC